MLFPSEDPEILCGTSEWPQPGPGVTGTSAPPPLDTISLGRQQSYLVLPTPSTPQPSLTLYQPTLVPWVTWITSQGPQSPREGGPPQPWKHWGFYAPVSLASGCQGQIGALGLRFQEGGVRRDRHGWPWPKRQELQGLDTWNTRGQVPLTDISIWAYGRGV